MTAEKLYELLTKAGVQFDVVEVFEGLRVINVMVEEGGDRFEKEIKLYDEEGNYMGMMGGHEVRK